MLQNLDKCLFSIFKFLWLTSIFEIFKTSAYSLWSLTGGFHPIFYLLLLVQKSKRSGVPSVNELAPIFTLQGQYSTSRVLNPFCLQVIVCFRLIYSCNFENIKNVRH